MKFEFFKKTVDPRIELVETLIEELDDLYDDMSYVEMEDRTLQSDLSNESSFRRYELLKNQIDLRESTINRMLK